MFKVTINNSTYEFPDRITIPQWKEIMRWDLEQPHNWGFILASALGCHPADLAQTSDAQLQLLIGILIEKLSQRTETAGKDLTQLTFGEWIDLDCYISSGVRTNIDAMLGILGQTEYSDEGLHKIEAYNNYRTYIYKQYSELFGLEWNEDEMVDTGEEPVDPQSVPEGWFSIIIGLSSDNLLNIDSVTGQPLIKTLNFMAHQKSRQIADNFKKYKQQKENELQRRR